MPNDEYFFIDDFDGNSVLLRAGGILATIAIVTTVLLIRSEMRKQNK